MKLLLDDGDEHVGGDGAPDLHLHRILSIAQEAFDEQVLLDPFEKQLHLPAAPVQLSDRQGRQGSVVGEEDQVLGGDGILEADATQMLRIAFGRMRSESGSVQPMFGVLDSISKKPAMKSNPLNGFFKIVRRKIKFGFE